MKINFYNTNKAKENFASAAKLKMFGVWPINSKPSPFSLLAHCFSLTFPSIACLLKHSLEITKEITNAASPAKSTVQKLQDGNSGGCSALSRRAFTFSLPAGSNPEANVT